MSNMSWLNWSVCHVFVCCIYAHENKYTNKHTFTHSITITGTRVCIHINSFLSNNNAGVFLFSHQKSTHSKIKNQNPIQFLATTHIKSGNIKNTIKIKNRKIREQWQLKILMKTIWCVCVCVMWADIRSNMLVQMQANEVEKAIF